MKGLLVFDILNYLYENDVINETQVDITDFINGIKKNSGDKIEQHNINRINKAVLIIRERDYGNLFSFKNGEATHLLTIDTDRVQAVLNLRGYDYVVEERRKRDTDKLNTTIKENTVVQKKSAIIMAWFTGAIVLLGLVNTALLLAKPQQNSFQLSPRTEQLLDSILKSQIRTDSILLLKESAPQAKKK
jgi:alpha-tubulin suppressor-like RCC1 family protein